MTRDNAHQYLKKVYLTTKNDSYREALSVALTALRFPTREMVERMRGCSDCEMKACISCKRYGRVQRDCISCNNQDKWVPHNFCPVCGKPLTEEAVDMMLERWMEAFFCVGN